MSKFAAWAKASADGTPTAQDNGIRLQTSSARAGQDRNYIPFELQPPKTYPGQSVDVTSTDSEANWEKEHLIDGNPDTAWSSKQQSGPDSAEAFAFWFGFQEVNRLILTPRRWSNQNRKALCFPEKIEIQYAEYPNGVGNPGEWKSLRLVSLADPGLSPGDVQVSLNHTIRTDGLKIVGSRLRTDQFGNFYFQLAGAQAGYQSLSFDEDMTRHKASLYPNSLFFFGDEPDLYMPANEYARVYAKFVALVKQGSNNQARVSPAGFTFSNNINGASYTEYAHLFILANTALGAQVDEWRFHAFYWNNTPQNPSAFAIWQGMMANVIQWCQSHDVNMTLGSFGSPDSSTAGVDMRPYHQIAMDLIAGEGRIVDAVWWSYDFGSAHDLVDAQNNLTIDGQFFKQHMLRTRHSSP